MARFVHPADLRPGGRATDAPEPAEAVREQRFLARERVDFLVVAGDLFEDNQVPAETSDRATEGPQMRIVASRPALSRGVTEPECQFDTGALQA